ncbi:serine hydrolase domain-containing protein [Actinomycetota bacterium]
MTDALDIPTLGPAGPVTLDNWADPGYNRWSFLNLDSVLPTVPIAAVGDGIPFPRRDEDILSAGTPRHDGVGQVQSRSTVRDVLDDTWTDGFVVLHHGHVVCEEYRGEMTPETRHLIMSVTKSVVGVLVCDLVDEGLCLLTDAVEDLVPDLMGSGFAGATLRDLLDMRSGVRFNETYHDPDADVYLMEHAVGWRPPRADVPSTMHEYLASLPSDGPHGGKFRYRSSETNVLGWICEEVTGRPFAELLAERVWGPLGAGHSAHITVDREGSAVADGGLSATLMDVARFAEMLRRNGISQTGAQVAPEWFISDTLLGAEDSKDAFAKTNSPTGMPGGHYRNQLWVPFRMRTVILGLGIHGQMVYINQRAGVVGVKLSTWPTAQNATAFYDTLGAFDAIAASLTPHDHHLRESRLAEPAEVSHAP